MDADRPCEPLFSGVAVALVSLFDNERLLVEDTARHAARVAAEGASAIVLAGTTGEPWLLSAEERVVLTAATHNLVVDIPVIVGTGHPDTAEAVRLTAAVRDAGADAVMAISPPGSEDLVGYYEAIATAAGDLPVIAYHFPQVSAPGIPVSLLEHLPISAVKDSSGDAERLASELQAWQGHLYVGSPLLLAAAGSFGATGAITALANLDVARCQMAFRVTSALSATCWPITWLPGRTFPCSSSACSQLGTALRSAHARSRWTQPTSALSPGERHPFVS